MTFQIEKLRNPIDGRKWKAEASVSEDGDRFSMTQITATVRIYARHRIDCEHMLKREILRLIHELSSKLTEDE